MNSTPRPPMPQQLEALAYAYCTRHPALFMEMRLGKTLVVIRRMKDVLGRVLVLGPSSVLAGWEKELALEGETFVRLTGPREKRLEAFASDARWCLINYEGWRVVPELFGRNRCDGCRGKGCECCGNTGHLPGPFFQWAAIVLDESTRIKNPRTKTTRFLLEHGRRVAVRRWILTGTPRPESDLDYWCQLAFLDGSAFGCHNYWQFRSRWFTENHYTYTIRPERHTELRRTVAQRAYLCSRRDARMPDKIVRQTRVLRLPKRVRRMYDEAEHDFELDGLSTIYAGTRWQWLRQLCGGFTPSGHTWSGKLDELFDLLRGELRNEQVVVWFAYNREIEAAWNMLCDVDRVAYVSGPVPVDQREEHVQAFQKGTVRVLLAQQAVAQYGMDLSCADTAIYYSRHASGQMNTQSRDRIVHPRKTWPLLQIDIMVKDTVDEDVHDLVAVKAVRSQAAIDRALLERLRIRIAKRYKSQKCLHKRTPGT